MPPMRNIALALLGAAVGGAVGYFAFGWFLRQGFYALVLPGGLLGLGAGLGRVRSLPLAIILALAAVVLGFYAEWSHLPFVRDHSLGYFVSHIGDLGAVTFLMIAVGAAIAFWGGYDPLGRIRRR